MNNTKIIYCVLATTVRAGVCPSAWSQESGFSRLPALHTAVIGGRHQHMEGFYRHRESGPKVTSEGKKAEILAKLVMTQEWPISVFELLEQTLDDNEIDSFRRVYDVGYIGGKVLLAHDKIIGGHIQSSVYAIMDLCTDLIRHLDASVFVLFQSNSPSENIAERVRKAHEDKVTVILDELATLLSSKLDIFIDGVYKYGTMQDQQLFTKAEITKDIFFGLEIRLMMFFKQYYEVLRDFDRRILKTFLVIRVMETKVKESPFRFRTGTLECFEGFDDYIHVLRVSEGNITVNFDGQNKPLDPADQDLMEVLTKHRIYSIPQLKTSIRGINHHHNIVGYATNLDEFHRKNCKKPINRGSKVPHRVFADRNRNLREEDEPAQSGPQKVYGYATDASSPAISIPGVIMVSIIVMNLGLGMINMFL